MQGIDHLADAACQASAEHAEQSHTAPPPIHVASSSASSSVHTLSAAVARPSTGPHAPMSRGKHHRETLLAAPPEPKTKHRQACLQCRQLKIRCEVAEDATTASTSRCARCSRLNIDCLWKEASRRGRKPKPWPDSPAKPRVRSPSPVVDVAHDPSPSSSTSSNPNPLAAPGLALPTPPILAGPPLPPPPPPPPPSLPPGPPTTMQPFYHMPPVSASIHPPPIVTRSSYPPHPYPHHHPRPTTSSSYPHASPQNDAYSTASPSSLSSLVDVARARELALSNMGKQRTKVTARPVTQPIYREPHDVVDEGLLTEHEAAQLFD
ncbi:hypothetical protein JCM10212_001602, partial [Sporobolomyces blumeae]